MINRFKLVNKKGNNFIFSGNKFIIMIMLAVLITSFLVFVSLSMYRESGAIQLDLSRPGYVSVRDKAVKNDDDFQNYSGTGEINQASISEFQALFTKQAKKVKLVDAFGGDPLSPASLGVGEDTSLGQ